MRRWENMRKAAVRGLLLPVVAVAALALTGCGGGVPTAPLVPPPGFIYTDYKAPMDIDFSDQGQPTPAVDGRLGQAQANYFYVPFTYGLLSFAWGDASIESASRDGKIQKVHYADYESMNILGIYSQFKTNVHGE